ncbi:hypothetical protein THIOSC15_2880016 [uncultured Thiomicrorhabdus sp.]
MRQNNNFSDTADIYLSPTVIRIAEQLLSRKRAYTTVINRTATTGF